MATNTVLHYLSNIETNETMELDFSESTTKYEDEITDCLKHLDLKDKICMFETIDTNYYDVDSIKYARIIIMTESGLIEYLHSTDYGYFSSEGISVLNIQNDGLFMYRRIFNPSNDIIKKLGSPILNIALDTNLYA